MANSNRMEDLNMRDLPDELRQCIESYKNDPDKCSMLIIASGNVPNRGLVMMSYLENPDTVATVLLNEAMAFNRQDDVLTLIKRMRRICDIAEFHIRAHTNRQMNEN